ncbi:unnamed protein product [Prorocentrum cordatum]|uniref:Uncharacterized protein n=1 Tax=Prorocentrum cordatum TaxID=2364126 RepID=A0ABN9UAX6_9DINO|nr:unnamed protein product [Polarella glacialis]
MVSLLRSSAAAALLLASLIAADRSSPQWVQIRPTLPAIGCSQQDCGCAGFEKVELNEGDETNTGSIDGMRAVKYWPEPIGYKSAFINQSNKDPYTLSFAALHSRDLPLMRNELGADAVLLGPWSIDSTSHSDFLAEAKTNNLNVIPSFDIAWYWADGNWQTDGTSASLQLDFRSFLENSAERVGSSRPYTPDSVLMWNVVGLPDISLLLPRQCFGGAVSSVKNFRNCLDSTGLADATATMEEFQQILETIRTEQKRYFCTQGPYVPADCEKDDDQVGAFTFDRPLSLTVELGPDFSLAYSENVDYINGLMYWMERVLGCRQVSERQVEISVTFNDTLSHCRFNGRGFFDAWVVKVVTAASQVQAEKMVDLVRAWHPARQYLDGDSAQGDGVALEEVSGVMKPVVFEYGFPALSPTGVMDAAQQHALLGQVWDGLKPYVSDQGGASCVRGAVVDEWVDVWSADLAYDECADQVSSQFKHSACGPSSDAGTIAVGFLGIMGQFDTFLVHCIDQRVEGSDRFQFQELSGEDVIQSVAWLPFGIDGEYGQLNRCRPVWLRPGLPVLAWFTAMALTVSLTLLSCCLGCCCCRGSRQDSNKKHMHEHELSEVRADFLDRRWRRRWGGPARTQQVRVGLRTFLRFCCRLLLL